MMCICGHPIEDHGAHGCTLCSCAGFEEAEDEPAALDPWTYLPASYREPTDAEIEIREQQRRGG